MRIFIFLLVFVLGIKSKAQTRVEGNLGHSQNDSIPDIVTFSEQMPEYPGGQEAMMKFLNEKLNYPSDAREAGVTGRVLLQFVVTDEGKIVKVENVRKDVDERLVNEAIRVVSLMPDWKPGRQDGKNVSVKFMLPIVFSLGKKGKG